MPVAWDNDRPNDARQLVRNVRTLLGEIVATAHQRLPPSITQAQQWHRDLYQGMDLPVPYFAGEIRNSDPRFPELFGYEVRVGQRFRVPSSDVPEALASFEASFTEAVNVVDHQMGYDIERDISRDDAELYVTLVAVAHGEWIRIHPFANGNGRVARLWAHWLAARYNLPPLLPVKPRPNDRMYMLAASASMSADHTALRAWLLDQFLS